MSAENPPAFPTPTYNADYFIAKFSAIPDDKWCERHFTYDNRFCALGHCGENANDTTEESMALRSLFRGVGASLIGVNDDLETRFHQPTPKARILAALHDIKSKEAK